MPNRAWSMHEWVSRLLIGGAVGCGMLAAADLLFIIPFWGPRLLKSDARWETVFIIAKFGLPAALALGAMGGLVWRRASELKLSPGPLVGCCLAIALMSQMLRPVVSRLGSRWFGPLYEVIPDTLSIAFCVVAAAVLAWQPGSRSAAPVSDPGATADGRS